MNLANQSETFLHDPKITLSKLNLFDFHKYTNKPNNICLNYLLLCIPFFSIKVV